MSTVNVGIVSPVIRGAWDITEDYNRLNIVHHTDGATYQAIQAISAEDEIDISNTDYWMQLTPKAPTFTAEDVAFDAGGSVENTGTAMAPELSFKVPRGVTGNESIDDTAGSGDDDVVWSADKTFTEVDTLKKDLYGQRVPSGNLFHLDAPSYYKNGVTVVNNYDGTFTANGTASAGSVYLNFCEIVLDSDKTISTMAAQISGTGPEYIRFYGYDANDTSLFNTGPSLQTHDMHTGDYIRVRLAAKNDVLTNFKFAIYISEGNDVAKMPQYVNDAPLAVSYAKAQTLTEEQKETARDNIGIDEVIDRSMFFASMQKLSANLVGFEDSEITDGGLTITNNYDGTYTVNGESIYSIYLYFLDGTKSFTADKEDYYTCRVTLISGTRSDGNLRYAVYADNTFEPSTILLDMSNQVDFTSKLSVGNSVRFRLAQAGTTFDNYRFGVFFAKGTKTSDLPYTIQREHRYTPYATEYLAQEDTLVDSVTEDRDANTITVTLITDTHYREKGGLLYRNTDLQGKYSQIISKKLNADCIIHMGDVIQGYDATYAINHRNLVKYWEKQSGTVPTMYCIAHHEMFGDGEEAAYLNDPTANTVANCIGICGYSNMWKDAVFSSDRTNWYFDYQAVRFIGLNSVTVSSAIGFRAEDVAFLHEALVTDKKVVVFAHTPVIYYKTVVKKDDVIGELNDFIDGGGTVLAYIHGHVHCDNIIPASSSVKFPQVSVCCALPSKVEIPDNPIYVNATAPDREIGTYTEYCFDVCNIHTDTGTINFFRFGAGSNRTL